MWHVSDGHSTRPKRSLACDTIVVLRPISAVAGQRFGSGFRLAAVVQFVRFLLQLRVCAAQCR